jgi:hypothetical protein
VHNPGKQVLAPQKHWKNSKMSCKMTLKPLVVQVQLYLNKGQPFRA